ncbi:hypothetical protein HJFPF1_12456 [Paramyrothecium foliicola]|nr:hypothetical protein HJFPF1_12456 [Paramyrothecium foliicola]
MNLSTTAEDVICEARQSEGSVSRQEVTDVGSEYNAMLGMFQAPTYSTADFRSRAWSISQELYLPREEVVESSVGVSALSWFESVCGIEDRSTILDLSLLAFCAAQLHVTNLGSVSLDDAQGLYSNGLQRLSTTLQHLRPDNLVSVLASIVILSTCELFICPSDAGWRAHVHGIAEVLRLHEAYQQHSHGSRDWLRLCARARMMTVLTELMSRRKGKLTPSQWRGITAGRAEEDSLEDILDIAHDLPAIFETAGAPKFSITAMAAVLRRMRLWEGPFRRRSTRPLFEFVPSRMHNPADDEHGSRLHETVLEFRSLPVARCLLIYWSVTVQTLDLVVSRCNNDESFHQVFQTLGEVWRFLDTADSGCKSAMEIITAEARTCAELICQSVEYMYRREMGLFGPQCTGYARWAVVQHYQQLSMARELVWCQNIPSMTGPGAFNGVRIMDFQSIASIPAVRALALSAVLWLLVFAYCDQALWRDPHGAYFHSEHIYDLGYSRARQQQARDFLKQQSDPSLDSSSNATRTQHRHAADNPVLCAAFVSVRREHPDAAHYFSDAIGSMLHGLSSQERAALNLTVLFANAADPAQHPDFAAPWMPRLVDHSGGYQNVSDDEMAELRRLEAAQDFQRKGVLDYLYVLDRCHRETNAPFIAVFEDDIVFAADWMARTLLGLQYLASHPPTATGTDKRPWLYLRLFYTETFMSWDDETDYWYAHLTMTFALASFTTVALLVLLRQIMWVCGRSNSGRDKHGATARSWFCSPSNLGLRLDMATIVVLSAIVTPAFTVLVFMAGKYNLPTYALHGASRAVGNLVPGTQAWQKHAGVLPMDQQGCCTQALVFDRARVPDLMAYLRKRERGQTDLMIEEYCREKSLRRFALGEQAVQHMGVVSSRGGNVVNGQSVWAFYFEESSLDKIETRHQSTLKRIDWSVFQTLQG